MYKEYYELWQKYVAEFGSRTAIFLMVGSFYELYDVQDETGRTKMNVKDIVDILGIQLKVKRGDAPGGADGLFSGFPDYVLHKWAGKLTGAGWTVVVVDQVKDRHDKVVERRVARILSPGTHLEALGTHEAPTIVSLWITGNTYAAAAFDLSTGSTYTMSGSMRSSLFGDELLHFLSVFLPRELVVFGNADPKQLDLPASCAVHVRPATLGSMDLPLPRSEYLRRLYAPRTILPLLEYLHLENVNEEKALAGLLRFVEDHEPSSFSRLKANQSWHPDNALLLGNHALSQLQIIGDGGVLDLFKYAATTPFGKRALRARLLSPSADPTTICQRLDAVAAMEALEPATAKAVFRSLRNIYDLPRLHRKAVCAELGAAELLALQSSYVAALEIMELLNHGPAQAARIALESLSNLFDLDRAATENPNQSWLPSAAHPEIAAIEAQLVDAEAEAGAFLKVLCEVASGFRFESKDSQPYAVRGTRTALTTLKASLGTPAARALNCLAEDQRTLTVSIQKGGGWVESAWLDRLNGRVTGLRDRLQRSHRLALVDVCVAFCDATGHTWNDIEEWVAAVDCSLGLATESRARNWCRPTIADGAEGGMVATGLRHPIIESLVTREAYVAHDVNLNTDRNRGWLVYGMNASGKSSLMKSIGIAIHLAQVGCYVPATSFTLVPYSALFTRILNQDNLWAGLSSFAVEMSEMRDILKAAGPRTMVLGDELCSGTESVSAKALVAAGIEWLADRGASYVFATHLHGLTDILPNPESIGLSVYHLKVIYDSVNRKLIYERHLTPGPGSSLYGIEVARAMNVPVAFLEKALAKRRQLLGTVADEDAPRSSWNAAVIRRACELCGADSVSDLEVHHVRQRADGGGNEARNLMVLCSACHDRHHALTIPESSVASQPLTLTSDGLERIVPAVAVEEALGAKTSTPTTKGKAKWTDEERATILKVLATYPNLPAKQVVFRLKQVEGIEISEGTLRKFKNAA
jgi:DNA mismatch repair protein MutS